MSSVTIHIMEKDTSNSDMTLKHIVMVIGSPSVGGAELQMLRLYNEFKIRNLEVELCFLSDDSSKMATKLHEWPAATFLNISPKTLISGFLNLIRLILKNRKKRGAIYYLILPHSILFFVLPLKLISRNSKIVAGVRSSIFKKDNLLYKAFRLSLKFANEIVCNSQAIADEINGIQKNAGRFKTNATVIHNGVDFYENKSQALKPTKALNSRILVLANFHTYKGHDLLLEALSHNRDLNLEIFCLGEGATLGEVVAKAKMLRSCKFHFLGTIQDQYEKQKLMKSMDFALHPSRTEGLSNAILEELAIGLPVIAFDVGGNSEIITSGQNGILVKAFDTEAMYRQICKLALSPTVLARMSREASIGVKRFSWENSVKLHLKVFNAVSKQRS